MSSTTTYRITRISVLKTARLLALAGALPGLPIGFFAQIPAGMLDAWHWMPFLYGAGCAVAGLLAGLLGAGLYNLLAPRIGGIEWTVRVA